MELRASLWTRAISLIISAVSTRSCAPPRKDTHKSLVPVPSTENGQKISSPLKPSTSTTDLQQLAEGQSDEQQTVGVPFAPPVLSRKAKLAMVRAMIEDLEEDEDALAVAEVQAAQAKAAELEIQLALLKAAAQKVSEAMVWCTRAHPSGGEEMHALRGVLEAME